MNNFSKPLGDISLELGGQIRENEQHLKRQKAARAQLLTFPDRTHCGLCESSLKGVAPAFQSRGISFLECPKCSQILTQKQPSPSYPFEVEGYNFAKVYRALPEDEFRSRVARVYKPKLDWLRGALLQNGWSNEKLATAKWVELGCGAGYFLQALTETGAMKIHGLDADAQLVKLGQERFGNETVSLGKATLPESIQAHPAEIYVSFFVFEHIYDLASLFREISKLPIGTVICFAVPTFGVSVMLEAASDLQFARNLDASYHTQLFTDASLRYAMKAGGLKMISQWVFGQDATDFQRFFHEALKDKLAPDFFEKKMKEFSSCLDGIQSTFDQNFLSDQRHIVGIRV